MLGSTFLSTVNEIKETHVTKIINDQNKKFMLLPPPTNMVLAIILFTIPQHQLVCHYLSMQAPS